MTDNDNDALITRLERLLPQMADPDWLRGEELPATASLVSMLPAILAALRTPQPDETETLRAEVVRLNGKLLDIKRRCLRHPDDTPEDDTRDKRIAYTIASAALKGTDHGRG